MSKALASVTDWFGRRAEDGYTFYDESKRSFDWDKGRGSYTGYLLGRRNDSSALKDTAKLLGSMFSVVGVPRDISFTPTETGKATGLHIPVSMLRDEHGKYTMDAKQADAFLGLALQNAAMAAMQTKSEYQRTLDAVKSGSEGFSLKKFMFNLLNTERIGKRFADRYPGYTKFIQKYKEQAYDTNYTPLDDEDPAHLRLLDLVTKMIRFPKHVTEEELLEFKKPIESIARLLKRFDGDLPDTFEEADSMATSLARIVVEFIPEDEEEEEEPGGPGGGGTGPGRSGGGRGIGSSMGMLEEEDVEMLDPDRIDGTGGGTMGGMSPSGPPPPPAEPEEPEPAKTAAEIEEEKKAKREAREERKKELEELAKKRTEELMKAETEEKELSEEEQEEFQSAFEEFVDDMTEEKSKPSGGPELGIDNDYLHWAVAGNNTEEYQRSMARQDMTKARVLQTLFKRKSKDLDFAIKGQKSGRLDTNKLAEARQGVNTIYERLGHVQTNKICVVVLIDESGSMMSSGKIQRARDAAVFINEAFGKLHDVELFIYGHTADGYVKGLPSEAESNTAMMIYREPGKNIPPHALGSVLARSNNRDGKAIISVAKRVRTFTQNQGIFLVISDGAPAATNYYDGMEDTRQKVLQAEKMGLQVVQIAVDSHVPSEKMFRNFIKMTNIKTLPTDMVRYMSRRMDSMIRERISL